MIGDILDFAEQIESLNLRFIYTSTSTSNIPSGYTAGMGIAVKRGGVVFVIIISPARGVAINVKYETDPWQGWRLI